MAVNGYLKHARTLSLLTMLSRVLGMFRESALAAAFGTSDIMGAFNIAFNLPNLFRRLLGEGALSAAFIPVFTGLVEQNDDKAAQRLANLVMTLLVATLAAVTLAGEAIIFLLSRLPDPTERFRLSLSLSAIMLPFVLTICLVAFLQAILNVRRHFAAPALAPILLNLFIIAAAVVASPAWSDDKVTRIRFVAVSVLVAGIVQVLVQVPPLRRRGFRFRPVWDTASPQLRQILRLMLPMLIGLGIVQLNTYVDQLIAMGFSQPEAAALPGAAPARLHLLGYAFSYPMRQGAISVLNYAQRLYELPVGVFTIALGTAIFPALARHAHHKDHRGIAETLNHGLRLAAFIGLPCTVGIIVIATPLVRLILQHGAFRPDDTPRVAAVTSVYVIGLVVFSALHLVTRAFFAMQETRLPVKSSACAAAANFLLNVTLIWPLGVAGLAVATVITATGQTIFLTLALRRRVGRLGLRAFLASLLRTTVASAAMGLAAWAAMLAAQRMMVHAAIDTQAKAFAALSIAAAVLAGGAVFALVARLMRMSELSEVLRRGGRDKAESQ